MAICERCGAPVDMRATNQKFCRPGSECWHARMKEKRLERELRQEQAGQAGQEGAH